MTYPNAVGDAHESKAGNRERSDPSHPEKLVWEQVNAWVWVSECGRFKIERFIAGLLDSSDLHPWPNRYRVLKHTPEWYFEAAPGEPTLAAAQVVCEGLA